MSLSDLVLSVDKIEFTRNGVRGFIWPISRHETLAVRDNTVEALANIVRRGLSGRTDAASSELLSILFVEILGEVLEVYQAEALTRRFMALGYRPVIPQGSALSRLSTGGLKQQAPLLKELKNGIRPKHNPLRFIVRSFRRNRTHQVWNGISRNMLLPFNPKAEIAAVQQHLPLIRRHAIEVPDFVRAVDTAPFFGPLPNTPAIPTAANSSHSAARNDVLCAISDSFKFGNEQLSATGKSYLSEWLAQAMHLVSTRLDSLENGPKQIPGRLWTGNGIGIWNRILRHATRRSGGTVTGHDHGSGEAHLHGRFATIGEFESCDEFYTFTEAAAESLRADLRPELMLSAITPTIHSTPDLPRLQSRRSFSLDIMPSINRVMYTSSFYTGYRGASFVINLPDIVAFDWETRLFQHLSEWGFETLHKPHPGSVATPRHGYMEEFQGKLLTDPFEAVMNQADAFIFIRSQSSITSSLLASGKPAVFIDLGLTEWTEDAYALLAQRCAIVPGWFDSDNRIQVEWGELHSAINESRHLQDTTIAERYWGTFS